MVPSARRLEVMGEDRVDLLPHADDAIGHSLDFSLPLSVESRVAQDLAGDTSTMGRRVGVHGSDDDLELAVDTGLLLRVGNGQGERSGTLAVETHVLGERLRDSNLMALCNKVADSESISRDVARSEALVGHIEEGEELPLLDDVGNGGPLLGSGVNTSRVVGTSMEKDDRMLRSSLKNNRKS